MNTLIISFILFGALAAGPNCPVYSNNYGWETDVQCMVHSLDDNIFTTYLRACNKTDASFCDYESPKDSIYCSADTRRGYPGYSCTNDKKDLCMSGNCDKGVCTGLSKDATCKANAECNPGLFCTGKCQPLSEWLAPCTDIPCKLGLVCSKGICQKMGLNKTENIVGSLQECMSYFGEAIANSSDFKCKDAPQASSALKKANYICGGEVQTCKDQKGDYNLPCVCGTKPAQTVCKKFPGDVNIQDYFDYMNEMVSSQKCHFEAGPLCMYKNVDDMSVSWAKAYIAFTDFSDYSKYVDNPEFVKNTMNKLYYQILDKALSEEDSKFGLYLFLGIAIGAVFVIAILLLVIYFKRRKGEEEDTAGATAKLT
jgi:hypothetical protein